MSAPRAKHQIIPSEQFLKIFMIFYFLYNFFIVSYQSPIVDYLFNIYLYISLKIYSSNQVHLVQDFLAFFNKSLTYFISRLRLIGSRLDSPAVLAVFSLRHHSAVVFQPASHRQAAALGRRSQNLQKLMLVLSLIYISRPPISLPLILIYEEKYLQPLLEI